MKKSFIIHLDSLDILDELSLEQAGKLLHAFRDFHNEIEPDLESILRIVFLPFKKQFQRDIEKYDATIIRNSLNGSKGGRPKKPTKTKQNRENPVGILAYFSNADGKVVHVGILLDDDRIIHAYGKVRIDHLTPQGIVNTVSGELTHKLSGLRLWPQTML